MRVPEGHKLHAAGMVHGCTGYGANGCHLLEPDQLLMDCHVAFAPRNDDLFSDSPSESLSGNLTNLTFKHLFQNTGEEFVGVRVFTAVNQLLFP